MGGGISGNEKWWWVWYLRWVESVSVVWWSGYDRMMGMNSVVLLPPSFCSLSIFFPYIFSSRFSHPSAFWKAHSKPPFSLKLAAPSLFFFPDIFSLKPSPKSPYSSVPTPFLFLSLTQLSPIFLLTPLLCPLFKISHHERRGWRSSMNRCDPMQPALGETGPHSKTCCHQSAPKII